MYSEPRLWSKFNPRCRCFSLAVEAVAMPSYNRVFLDSAVWAATNFTSLRALIAVCQTYSEKIQVICIYLTVFVTYSESVYRRYSRHTDYLYAGCMFDIQIICMLLCMSAVFPTYMWHVFQDVCGKYRLPVFSCVCSKYRLRVFPKYSRHTDNLYVGCIYDIHVTCISRCIPEIQIICISALYAGNTDYLYFRAVYEKYRLSVFPTYIKEIQITCIFDIQSKIQPACRSAARRLVPERREGAG